MAEPIFVRVRDCECPGAPHAVEGDGVYVAPTASLTLGLAAQGDIMSALGDGAVLAQKWLVTFVRHGATAWNFENEAGPIPFDVEVILADFALASPVAEKCDELYGDTVTRPLVQRLNKTSPTGQTAGSTSGTPTPIRSRRKRSSPATSADTKQSVG